MCASRRPRTTSGEDDRRGSLRGPDVGILGAGADSGAPTARRGEGPRRELRRWCKERRLSLAAPVGVGGCLCPGRRSGRGARHRAAGAARRATRRCIASLLAGFCTSVGVRGEEGEYLGTRGVRFHIFPGSPLRRRKPRWVMAALHRRDELAVYRAARGRDRAAVDRGGRAAPARSASISSPIGMRLASRSSPASASRSSA